jgi:putative DNA primase/helicase
MGGSKFEDVAAAALAMAPLLLSEWLGGGPKGHEWLGASRSNGGRGDSWSVNLNTGQFAHFAGPEKGGDLVALYAALNHLDQGAALKQVAELVGVTNGATVRTLPPAKAPESPCEPIPQDPPDLPVHGAKGTPTAIYRYGRAFWVARYDSPEGKSFTPYTWRRGKWVSNGYPAPKPMYGLEGLAQHPGVKVLIVEGEKCADAAAKMLRGYVVISWANGAQAWRQTDWAPLTGRDVLIWPDADDAGTQCAADLAKHLSKIAGQVRVIVPDRTDGWDVADAAEEGWDVNAYAAWATPRIRLISGGPTPPAAAPSETESSPDATEDSGPATAEPALPPSESVPVSFYEDSDSAMVRWDSLRLEMNQGGLPYATLANASQILRMHPKLSSKLWFDTFQQKIWQSFHGPKREWTDADTADLTVFIQQSLKLNKFTFELVNKAVEHAARRNCRNSLTDWLTSLEWDGEPRLDEWLHDCLGVERSAYSIAVGNNWPISMVARAYVPGEKADHMPVLEGPMGRGKSSFLEILGGEWYEALTTAIGDKDFVQSLQGVWLVEIPDMAGFGRREHSLIISTITIRRDRYRASYGHHVENHPRGCILTATSETSDYLKTGNGRRRFWPLWCSSIDLDALRAQREQVFAEAVVKYRAGVSWHEMPQGTEDEQTARIEPDLWSEKILNYAAYLWDQSAGKTTQITSERLLKEVIDLDVRDHGQIQKNRINAIMRDADWIQLRTGSTRYWKRVERR